MLGKLIEVFDLHFSYEHMYYLVMIVISSMKYLKISFNCFGL